MTNLNVGIRRKSRNDTNNKLTFLQRANIFNIIGSRIYPCGVLMIE